MHSTDIGPMHVTTVPTTTSDGSDKTPKLVAKTQAPLNVEDRNGLMIIIHMDLKQLVGIVATRAKSFQSDRETMW